MPILLKVQTPLFGQIRRDRQPVDGLEDYLAVSRASPITSATRWRAWTQTQANIVP